MGVVARVGGRTVIAGNSSLVTDAPDSGDVEGSPIHVSVDGAYRATAILADAVRPGAAGAVVIIVIVVVVIGARGQRGQQRGGQGGMQGLKQEMAALHGRADCGSEKRRHRQQHERKAAQTLCV